MKPVTRIGWGSLQSTANSLGRSTEEIARLYYAACWECSDGKTETLKALPRVQDVVRSKADCVSVRGEQNQILSRTSTVQLNTISVRSFWIFLAPLSKLPNFGMLGP